MCGIWGLVGKNKYDKSEIRDVITKLFLLSESRGKEASGIAGLFGSRVVSYKKPVAASKLTKSPEYHKLVKGLLASEETIAVIGHSRLVTNGAAYKNQNNQPVSYGNVTTVHNGIIINADELWKTNKHLKKESDVDTEIFVKICEENCKKGMNSAEAIRNTFAEISGMTSVLTIFSDSRILVGASNNGSLYCWKSADGNLIIFASEDYMLRQLYKYNRFVQLMFNVRAIKHLGGGQSIKIDIDRMKVFRITVPLSTVNRRRELDLTNSPSIIADNYRKLDIDIEPIKALKRCTKCLLPETMPFIKFNNEGVCNYCETYKKMKYCGKDEMHRKINRIKNSGVKREYDSVVSFSGGRDSSYGLHYFVKELGLRPVAYNYDWGMVTDLARRNQSRMCSALGVELITVSADIRKKRDNIRKNILAWMKKPDLGLIPLFMAGDKEFFYYANVMKKRFMADCVLLASNPFETTYFKSAFCGVEPSILRRTSEELEVEQLSFLDASKMAFYYAKEFIANPQYINASLVDTAFAAASYYLIPHDYFRLYNYVAWDEQEIDDVLINEYGWEKATDTDSTWRIGDGTAPFYNYIYYYICGFTENDTLRSNQIREGKLEREKALELVYSDNQPRWDSLKWYFDVVGLDMEMVLRSVRKMKRLY